MGDVCVGSGSELRPGLPVDVGAVSSGSVCSSGSRSVFLLAAHFFFTLCHFTPATRSADQPIPTRTSAAIGLKQTLPGANDQNP